MSLLGRNNPEGTLGGFRTYHLEVGHGACESKGKAVPANDDHQLYHLEREAKSCQGSQLSRVLPSIDDGPVRIWQWSPQLFVFAQVNKSAHMIFLIAHNRVPCRQIPQTRVLLPLG